MNAKTTKSDERLMDMAEQSGIPELALLTAEVVDMKENARDNNDAVMKEIKSLSKMVAQGNSKMDKFITAQELKNQDIEDNTKDIKEIKKQNKLLATIGGGVSAVLTGISAWFLSKL